MTRKEAVEKLRLFDFIGSNEDEEFLTALDMAIKALEQEPILDKIRVEIENDWQLKKYPSSPFSCGLRRAIEIIDKHYYCSECKSMGVDY